jgi:glycosyltransferase involved in cell wall biosynthesis
VNWEEPFGLVMVEAMLSGTPVVASRRGSVPELVSSTTGRILDLNPSGIPTPDELKLWEQALREVEALDPEAIRREAVSRFSHHRMAESYLEVYKRVIQGETLP